MFCPTNCYASATASPADQISGRLAAQDGGPAHHSSSISPKAGGEKCGRGAVSLPRFIESRQSSRVSMDPGAPPQCDFARNWQRTIEVRRRVAPCQLMGTVARSNGDDRSRRSSRIRIRQGPTEDPGSQVPRYPPTVKTSRISMDPCVSSECDFAEGWRRKRGARRPALLRQFMGIVAKTKGLGGSRGAHPSAISPGTDGGA